MSDLVLYTNPMSRGRIARWMLEETGQDYRAEVVTFGPQMRTAGYMTINPMGKVPALVHGEAVVTEAPAICAYLADAFPAAKLAPPPGSRDRAAYYRWLFFAAGPIEQAVTTKALGFEIPEEKRGMIGFGSYERVFNALEDHLKDREYIATDTFTAADLYVGAHLGWGMQFGTVEKRPVFVRYYEQLNARPAAVRARQIDDALAAELQKPA